MAFFSTNSEWGWLADGVPQLIFFANFLLKWCAFPNSFDMLGKFTGGKNLLNPKMHFVSQSFKGIFVMNYWFYAFWIEKIIEKGYKKLCS